MAMVNECMSECDGTEAIALEFVVFGINEMERVDPK